MTAYRNRPNSGRKSLEMNAKDAIQDSSQIHVDQLPRSSGLDSSRNSSQRRSRSSTDLDFPARMGLCRSSKRAFIISSEKNVKNSFDELCIDNNCNAEIESFRTDQWKLMFGIMVD
jgi:hypothetical protein